MWGRGVVLEIYEICSVHGAFCMCVVIASKLALRAKDWSACLMSMPDLEYLPTRCYVCFPLQADCLHQFEWIPCFVATVAPEGEKKWVRAKFEVVAHHHRVHSKRFDRNGVINELIISTIRDSGSWLINFKYMRHAKSQWSPLSQLIS